MSGPMRAFEAQAFSLEDFHIAERAVPRPGRGDILIRIKAVSLNYRDLSVLTGTYVADLPLPFVPASDACGEVVELGEGVTRFKPGDRVAPTYIQGWRDGMPTPEQRSKRTLGAPLDGVLQDYVVVPAEDAVLAPAGLTDEEVACLPIAGVTAWSALAAAPIKSGDTVLTIGTGGVALFALQLAKLAGARVVSLSSSDEKLERVRALGADEVINYRTVPDWGAVVKRHTGGRGADIVVETGGTTLPQSLAAVAFGGLVAIVGFVGGFETPLNIRQVIGPMVRLQGIAVGSRASFEALNRAIEASGLKPVIDSTFPLERAGEAFRHMKAGAHFGKVVIRL